MKPPTSTAATSVGCPEFEQIFERLDAIGRLLTRLSGLDKQVAALRLEMQSWKATQDADLFELLTRIDQLEAVIDKGRT